MLSSKRMKVVTTALPLLAALAFAAKTVNGFEEMLSIHGSGTTNPSKCYWSIMEDLMTQSKYPVRFTYRAVGSTTGQEDFINGNDTDKSAMHFGSGDLPLSEGQYQGLKDKNVTVLQLPVLLGTVSFFHNVPGFEDVARDGADPYSGNYFSEPQGLNLTACLLGRIFSREIMTWAHPDIVAINPNLDQTRVVNEALNITVVRRSKGSSSTNAITNYIHDACVREMEDVGRSATDAELIWPNDNVGPEVTWEDDTVGAQGSSEVTSKIQDTPGAIGYIDSGHGLSAGLHEVHVPDYYGRKFLHSTLSAENNGTEVSWELLPERATDDFSHVSFIDAEGEYTWPMLLATYIYVRQDLTKMIEDPEEQALLVAFLEALYRDEYIERCVEDYGFYRLPKDMQSFATDSIEDDLITSFDSSHDFIFEPKDNTLSGMEGAQDYVISQKRKASTDVEIDALKDRVEELEQLTASLHRLLRLAMRDIEKNSEDMNMLRNDIQMLEEDGDDEEDDLEDLEETVRDTARVANDALDTANQALREATTASEMQDHEEFHPFGEDEERQLNVALALAALSFVFWIIFLIYLPLKYLLCGSSSSSFQTDGDEAGAVHSSPKNGGGGAVTDGHADEIYGSFPSSPRSADPTSRSESPTNHDENNNGRFVNTDVHDEMENSGRSAGGGQRKSSPPSSAFGTVSQGAGSNADYSSTQGASAII